MTTTSPMLSDEALQVNLEERKNQILLSQIDFFIKKRRRKFLFGN